MRLPSQAPVVAVRTMLAWQTLVLLGTGLTIVACASEADSVSTDAGDAEIPDVSGEDAGGSSDSGTESDGGVAPSDGGESAFCSVAMPCPPTAICEGGACKSLESCVACTDNHRCLEDGGCDCEVDGGDLDGDHHKAEACGGFDCDDSRPDVNPSAREVCDVEDPESMERDEDCEPTTYAGEAAMQDGRTLSPQALVDRGHVPGDLDYDGFVDERCKNANPDGGAPIGGDDCRDDNSDLARAVHPGGYELCDKVDNNCNGSVDEPIDQEAGVDAGVQGDAGQRVLRTADDDDDGYGAADGGTRFVCPIEQTPGWIDGPATDCDDHDPKINPKADENCDGRDNNCNGLVDQADPAFKLNLSIPSTRFVCAAGALAIESCPDIDHLWCSTPVADGCQTDATDLKHCRACNTDCKFGCGLKGCDSLKFVDVGKDHTCALSEEGRIACWGQFASGRLGHTSSELSAVPVWLPGIHDATKLSVGDAHACVIVGPQNELWCWGDNTFVQLGDSRIKGSTASPIPFLRDGAALTGVTAFAAGRNSTCAVVEAGQVVCSGDSTDGVLGDDVGPEPAASVLVLRGAAFLTDALQIGIGLTHACIVNAMHGVECWGGNRAGQLGQGHKDPASPGAHAVRGLASGVDAIAVGSNHACALASGKVYCWGSNSYGELGTRDSSAANDEPSEVTGIDDATSVSAGVNATCVERRDHSTVCFGNDLYGQIGSTLEVVPSKGPIAPDVGALKHVRTKGYHACGIRQDGAAICWGKNASGELGLGTKSAAPVVSLSPVQPVRYVGR